MVEPTQRRGDTPLDDLSLWVCEEHPWLIWPDEDKDCAGPGMLPRDALRRLQRPAGVIIKKFDYQTRIGVAIEALNGKRTAIRLRFSPDDEQQAIEWCAVALRKWENEQELRETGPATLELGYGVEEWQVLEGVENCADNLEELRHMVAECGVSLGTTNA